MGEVGRGREGMTRGRLSAMAAALARHEEADGEVFWMARGASLIPNDRG